MGLTISNVSFCNLLPHQKQDIVLYVSDFKSVNDKIRLKFGRALNKNDDFNKYLSTVNHVNDPNQVGIIKFFNKNINICIRPIEYTIRNSSIFGLNNFYVNTKDSKIIKKLISSLENKYGIKICNFGDYAKSENWPKIYKRMVMPFILYFLIFAIVVYIVFSRYKELAIYKMHGMNRNKIFYKYLLKEMIRYHFFWYIC